MVKTKILKVISCILTIVMMMPIVNVSATENDNEIWVNGVKVTDDNANDVLGNGTVSYDKEDNKLTLNNANITEIYNRSSIDSGIWATGDIHIVLEGENSITVSSENILSGICAAGVITISGSGTLNINAAGNNQSEVWAISTTYTSNEAGVVIDSGTINVTARGNSGIYAIYIDGSYGETPPSRYFKVNGGTVELDANSNTQYSCWATNTKPDFSGYDGYSATAIMNSWEELQAYDEQGWNYYRYIKIQPLEYDDNGISTDKQHYQPANLVDGYYEIKNAGNLYWFAEKLKESASNATLNARLVQNITMPEDLNWVAFSVGTYGTPYNGIFDGNHYTITNLTAKSDNLAFVYNNEGLFKTVGKDGVVKNLGMINPSITPDSGYAGAICGTNYGLIENCYNENGKVSVSSMYGGGIAGQNEGIIRQCYNTGTVTSQSGYSIGGIAGLSTTGSQIIDCYNTANIIGAWSVGGICGTYKSDYEIPNVSNCYSTGNINASYGQGYTNPIVWGNNSGVENCYYLSETSSMYAGMTNKTQEQFQSGEVAYLLNQNKSDKDSVWKQTIGEDYLPVFDGDIVYAGYEHCYSDGISYGNDASLLYSEKPEHHIAGEWLYGEDGHWQVCQNEGCNYKGEVKEHTAAKERVGIVEATAAREGYTGDVVCETCGYIMEKGVMVEKLAPTINQDYHSEYVSGSHTDISFEVDALSEDLIRITVNNQNLSEEAYQIVDNENGMIIRLKQECLDSLNAGEYTVQIVYQMGQVEATFVVVAKPVIDTDTDTEGTTDTGTNDSQSHSPTNKPDIEVSVEENQNQTLSTNQSVEETTTSQTIPETSDFNQLSLWLSLFIMTGCFVGVKLWNKKEA